MNTSTGKNASFAADGRSLPQGFTVPVRHNNTKVANKLLALNIMIYCFVSK